MSVKVILDEKGRDVVTVAARAALSEVITTLADRKIGAVVVVGPDDRIDGILSERDVVRALASVGVAALAKPVSEAMTSPVTVCSEAHTINQVMEIMTNKRFRHLPVEKNGRLAGIVSIGDVVRKRIEAVEREAEEMKAYIAG